MYILNKQEHRRAPNKIEPTTRETSDPNWPNKIRQNAHNMVLYSLEAVNSLLSPIQKIQGRPTFSSLWHIAQDFYDALRKIYHAYHPTDGWAGYLMTKEEFALRSTTSWTGPEIVRKYFAMSTRAITLGDQEQAKGEYKYKKKKPQTHMM